MATICVQMGHTFRTSGATGTSGVDGDPTEQEFAVLAASRAAARLAEAGHVAVIIDADEPISSYGPYDGFVAIHCDGSTSSSAHGASVGYQNGQGQQFADAFKDSYYAEGWRGFRPDNYTAALAGYYGVRNARAAGTFYAFIAECGFLTNPSDEAILQSRGADMFARALTNAVVAIWGGTPTEEDTLSAEEVADIKAHITAETNRAIKESWDGRPYFAQDYNRLNELGENHVWLVSRHNHRPRKWLVPQPGTTEEERGYPGKQILFDLTNEQGIDPSRPNPICNGLWPNGYPRPWPREKRWLDLCETDGPVPPGWETPAASGTEDA